VSRRSSVVTLHADTVDELFLAPARSHSGRVKMSVGVRLTAWWTGAAARGMKLLDAGSPNRNPKVLPRAHDAYSLTPSAPQNALTLG
jgi:hypothetical protein